MADEVVFRAHDEVPKDWAEKMAWSLFERGKVASPNIIADAFRHARNQALEEAAKVAESIKSYDDLVNKSAGCYTTGQSIAHAIRAMIK
jgi:hypothetical protein